MHADQPAAARRRAGTGRPYLLASAVLLGTGGLTGTLVHRVAGLSPVAVAGYRLSVGGALILLWLALTGVRPPRGRPAWTRVALVGALTAGYQASFFGSAALTSVSLATLVTIGTSPVIVLAVERATGRRRVDRRMAGTVALALTGLALLVGPPTHDPRADAAPADAVPTGTGPANAAPAGTVPAEPVPAGTGLAGTGLAVLAAVGFAAVTLLGARPVPGLDALSTVGFAFGGGGLLLLAVAGLTVGLAFPVGATAIGLIAALGTVPTALAYPLYFHGLRAAGAGTGAVLVLLEPLTSAVLAALVLRDRLGPTGIAGGVLLAAAVTLAARPPGRP